VGERRGVTELVLFGVGSPLVAEYEETCRRLGCRIAAGVRNRPGPVYLDGRTPVVEGESVPAELLATPCLCPLFRPANRRTALEEAAAAGFAFAGALIDPTAIVASTCTFGRGTFVNAGCIVGAHAALAEHVVINRGASVGHHVTIGAFASLGPGAVVAGNVAIERGAMLGAGAIVLPSVRIGADAVVGAGSVVVRDVPAGAKVLGNPARAAAPPLAAP
jgi:sugar O-acyltransferase (sialic acid O-acetyltransferase NeuD family)